jgi:sodium-dependent dicarboxylate transporter 2/3/5
MANDFSKMDERATSGGWRDKAVWAVAVAGAVAAAWLPTSDGLTTAGRVELGIVVLCAVLWMGELVPAFAVALLAIGLQVGLLGFPGGVLAAPGDLRAWEAFVVPWASPPMWLFLGGLFLGVGAERAGLDRWVAGRLLGWTGGRPQAVLAVVLGMAFVFSMLLSNTATAALLLTLLRPLIARLEPGGRTATALLLAVATGANLGGMGTVIGTPPNTIAVALLSDGGRVGFIDWLVLALPVALVCVTGAFVWLRRGVNADVRAGSVRVLELRETSGSVAPADAPHPAVRVLAVLGILATVLLWSTETWHGLSTGMVALIPVVLFPMAGLIRTRDLRDLSWDVLILLAGGLSLGVGIERTGLGQWVAGLLGAGSGTPWVGALLVTWSAAGLSNVMSNTAAANILLPIALAMVRPESGREGELLMGVSAALGCSLGMALPISTPPNALVLAGGGLRSRDFLPLGIPFLILGPPLVVAWCAFWLAR